MTMTKHTMPETMYRASRCCRVLGNPTAYLILRCLGHGQKTPTQLSKDIEVSLPTVCMTLRHLREMEVIRYETSGQHKLYWIKDERVLAILDSLEEWVEAMRGQQ